MTTWRESVVRAGDKKILPPRIFMYGSGGIGKTSLAASMPNCILVDYDHGADEVKVDQVPGPSSWEASLQLVRDIAKTPEGYKTLCIDTVDVLADQAEDHVSREAKQSFAKMNDNYGSGYQAVGVAWRVLLAELDEVRKRGLSICLLGHAVVRQATDPQLGPFDQFTAQLPKTPWALTQRWADAVLFAAFDAARNEKESRAIVTGERLMFTVRGSGYEAKNRYNLDAKMPLSWKALDAAIVKHRATSTQLIERILKLASTPELLGTAKGFIAQADGDLVQLRAIETSLVKKIAEAPRPTRTKNDGAADVEDAIYRILSLAAGTPHEDKAKKHIEGANGNLETLLAIEAALKARLAAPSPPPNGSATT